MSSAYPFRLRRIDFFFNFFGTIDLKTMIFAAENTFCRLVVNQRPGRLKRIVAICGPVAGFILFCCNATGANWETHIDIRVYASVHTLARWSRGLHSCNLLDCHAFLRSCMRMLHDENETKTITFVISVCEARDSQQAGMHTACSVQLV